MSALSPKVVAAFAIAMVYVVLATSIVRAERQTRGGGFITLHGMGSYLITLPVSLPGELSGHKIDFRNNWQMGFAIVACAALVGALAFAVLALLARLPWFHQSPV